MRNMKEYVAKAWVHPKKGGDDYQVVLKVDARDSNHAKYVVEKWLEKRSAITDDYVITPAKKLGRVI